MFQTPCLSSPSETGLAGDGASLGAALGAIAALGAAFVEGMLPDGWTDGQIPRIWVAPNSYQKLATRALWGN
jgi:hypothetical protein